MIALKLWLSVIIPDIMGLRAIGSGLHQWPEVKYTVEMVVYDAGKKKKAMATAGRHITWGSGKESEVPPK